MNRTGLKYSTLIAALIFSQVALSADEERLIEDYFSMRWFETEIIIFERPDVTETNTPEQLLVSDARSYPRDVRSLEVDASSYFQLDPMTQLCLAPTTLSYTVTPLEAILDEAQAMFEEDFPGELA
ncbi:MAG: hypothetical protein O3A63_20910, partial [Proteobacteria bacterium]|nr:hypothetical protein [Pseudomonadota bacterium]